MISISSRTLTGCEWCLALIFKGWIRHGSIPWWRSRLQSLSFLPIPETFVTALEQNVSKQWMHIKKLYNSNSANSHRVLGHLCDLTNCCRLNDMFTKLSKHLQRICPTLQLSRLFVHGCHIFLPALPLGQACPNRRPGGLKPRSEQISRQ